MVEEARAVQDVELAAQAVVQHPELAVVAEPVVEFFHPDGVHFFEPSLLGSFHSPMPVPARLPLGFLISTNLTLLPCSSSSSTALRMEYA